MSKPKKTMKSVTMKSMRSLNLVESWYVYHSISTSLGAQLALTLYSHIKQGEDGGASDWMASRGGSGWSYQSALTLLEKNDATKMSTAVPRMDVESLIQAKRRNLKKKANNDESQSEENSHDSDSDSESDSEQEESSDSEAEDNSGGADLEHDTLKTRTGQDDAEQDSNDEDEEEKTKGCCLL